MSWSLNNVKAPDAYSGASTLNNLPAVRRLTIDVSNQAVLIQLRQIATGGAGSTERMATWGNEEFILPGSKPINRPGIVGVRFRAAVKAASLPAGQVQAQVTVVVP